MTEWLIKESSHDTMLASRKGNHKEDMSKQLKVIDFFSGAEETAEAEEDAGKNS